MLMIRRQSIWPPTAVLAAVALLGAARTSAESRLFEDVVVLRSDARSILFEFRPVYSPARSVSVNGREFMVQEFRGASSARARGGGT